MRRHASVMLAALLLAGACTASSPDASTPTGADGADPCRGITPIGEPLGFAGLLCPEAVRVANARLGWLHWPISTTSFISGMPCPPNARCRASFNTATVVFTFWAGDPVMIVVTKDVAGVAAAADPEPLPTWMPVR